MRVTLVNQYYAPDHAATAQMLEDVGVALVRAGHDVTAICGDRAYGDPSVRYPKRSVESGVDVVRVRSTGFGRRTKAGRGLDYLTYMSGVVARLLAGKRPDVVVVLTTPPLIASVVVSIARLRGFRVVVWSMDVYPDLAFELGVLRPNSLLGRLLSFVARRTLRAANVTIALGPSMAERLQSGGARKVEIVHNWADGEAIGPHLDRDPSTRAAFGPDVDLLMLYSGNLGLAHEFETVLAGAQRLMREMPRVKIAFIGVGPRLEAVKAGVASRGLSNVVFRPYVSRDQLNDTLSAPDLHLVTLRPGMPGLLVPSKIYGILAAGRPTLYVGPAEGEVYQIVREGECGTAIAVGDVDAFVDAVRRYASDRTRLQREGANARRLFDERFSREIGLRRFVEIVESA